MRAVGFGIGVHAFFAAPDAHHAGKRAEMGKGVRINGSFGIDVCGVCPVFEVNQFGKRREAQRVFAPAGMVQAAHPQ